METNYKSMSIEEHMQRFPKMYESFSKEVNYISVETDKYKSISVEEHMKRFPEMYENKVSGI